VREFKFLRGYKRESITQRWLQFCRENNIHELSNERNIINELEGNFNVPIHRTQTFYGNAQTIEMLNQAINDSERV
jgi:porphobilinogen deaminase